MPRVLERVCDWINGRLVQHGKVMFGVHSHLVGVYGMCTAKLKCEDHTKGMIPVARYGTVEPLLKDTPEVKTPLY